MISFIDLIASCVCTFTINYGASDAPFRIVSQRPICWYLRDQCLFPRSPCRRPFLDWKFLSTYFDGFNSIFIDFIDFWTLKSSQLPYILKILCFRILTYFFLPSTRWTKNSRSLIWLWLELATQYARFNPLPHTWFKHLIKRQMLRQFHAYSQSHASPVSPLLRHQTFPDRCPANWSLWCWCWRTFL